MNANEIWSGQNYAYVPHISRGVTFYAHAVPVRILSVFKQKDYGAERGRTMCEVIMLNDDETLSHRTRSDGTELTKTVRARNIYARWDEHARVRAVRKREQEEREERWRREAEEAAERRRIEAEERERQRQELERRRAEENEHIYAWFERRGLKREDVSVTVNGHITIARDVLLRKVGLHELTKS